MLAPAGPIDDAVALEHFRELRSGMSGTRRRNATTSATQFCVAIRRVVARCLRICVSVIFVEIIVITVAAFADGVTWVDVGGYV